MRGDDTEIYDKGPPVMTAQHEARPNLLSSLARAVVSLTLLVVLLLAFGAALAGWFLRNQLEGELRAEIDRTSAQAQLVVAYRDELDALTARMATERVTMPAPTVESLYERTLEARQGRGPDGAWRAGYDWQAEIDLLQRDNTDIRWANAQIRARAARARNPNRPNRNVQP